jgi:arylsulfatase A
MKATMLEGGSRVPLLVNWPGTTPAGKVNHDLTDFSDFFGTFAELGGATPPEGVTIDSQSFAAQIKGEKGTPRDWIYVELSGKSYVRDARYKLTNKGDMFDLKNAPFEEIPVAADTTDEAAIAARKKLQAVLDTHPAGDASGIVKKDKKAARKGPGVKPGKNGANKRGKSATI